MKKDSQISLAECAVAVLLCAVFAVLWSVPALLLGDGFAVFPHLEARNFAETGLFVTTDALGRVLSTVELSVSGVLSSVDGRLSTLLIAWLSQWISWGDLVGWTVASASIFAGALLAWWVTVRSWYGRAVAIVTTTITALLPVYFHQAIWFENYVFAFFFIALAGAAYTVLQKKSIWVALLTSGLLFGAAAGAKDVCLIAVPWIAFCFLWQKRFFKGTVFFVAAFAVYAAPYVGDLSSVGYPVNQNLARIWPGGQQLANATYLHLYPDPYTYTHAREEFDALFLEAAMQKPFADRMIDEKVILSYGLDSGILRRLRLGFWLLAKDVFPLVQRQSVGGIFLLLFAIPGACVLWKTQRKHALWLAGLTVSIFACVRFVMLYERDHFMNVAWVFALLCGVGILHIASLQKQFSKTVVVTVITLVCAVQLLQANRYELASKYARSNVGSLRAIAEQVRLLPEDAVLAVDAHPQDVRSLALLSNRTIALFRSSTVDTLRDQNILTSVFADYGVTHAYGYASSMPVEVITVSEHTSRPPSSFLRRLVHIIR